MSEIWPSELKVSKDRRTLAVSFNDGVVVSLPAEMLRVLSPSAEVQGHGPGQAVTVPGKTECRHPLYDADGQLCCPDRLRRWPRHRDLHLDLSPELGSTGADKFADYERALAEKGLSRDPR